MKNQNVVENYFNGVNCHSLNVYASGENLINYNTVLVHFESNTYFVNISYYSTTTSKIQSYINNELNYIHYAKVRYYYGNRSGDNFEDYIKFDSFYSLDDNNKLLMFRYYKVNVNKTIIQFYECYKNSLSNLIERTILTDKNNNEYFRYNGNRYYLNNFTKIEEE